MLDFYFIQDALPTPGFPKDAELIYVGGMSLDDFTLLKTLSIIEQEFSYCDDFRWTSEQITIKFQALSKVSHISFDYLRDMYNILRKAQETQNGLIAYCD